MNEAQSYSPSNIFELAGSEKIELPQRIRGFVWRPCQIKNWGALLRGLTLPRTAGH